MIQDTQSLIIMFLPRWTVTDLCPPFSSSAPLSSLPQCVSPGVLSASATAVPPSVFASPTLERIVIETINQLSQPFPLFLFFFKLIVSLEKSLIRDVLGPLRTACVYWVCALDSPSLKRTLIKKFFESKSYNLIFFSFFSIFLKTEFVIGHKLCVMALVLSKTRNLKTWYYSQKIVNIELSPQHLSGALPPHLDGHPRWATHHSCTPHNISSLSLGLYRCPGLKYVLNTM